MLLFLYIEQEDKIMDIGKSIQTEKKFGFTLAEVLITLAIIGVVAAMTIPTIMNKYQQKVAETRLMKFYNVMNNAIALSEIDNGKKEKWPEFWEYTDPCSKATAYSENCLTRNFDKFFKPYLKISHISYLEETLGSPGGLLVNLPDGSAFNFKYFGETFIFYPIGSHATDEKHQIEDKDYFRFTFYPIKSLNTERNKYLQGKGLEPNIPYEWDGNEESLPCLVKAKLNGWKFPDDCNPWK